MLIRTLCCGLAMSAADAAPNVAPEAAVAVPDVAPEAVPEGDVAAPEAAPAEGSAKRRKVKSSLASNTDCRQVPDDWPEAWVLLPEYKLLSDNHHRSLERSRSRGLMERMITIGKPQPIIRHALRPLGKRLLRASCRHILLPRT